jgi:acyl-coenzyme A synthetase/AMP-(fatty) acid ligase
MLPVRLVDFLNEQGVNTVDWVASTLTMISGLGTLEKAVPRLHTVLFSGEVLPSKQFKLWREALPDVRFLNLYGPTEGTDMVSYYEVPADFDTNLPIPIGRAFPNTEIFLLDGDRLITESETPGEICIRGTSVTLGYYNHFERTSEVFVQNPLQSHYPEIVYRTGDSAKYNARGELVYIGRKDDQIKHMGYRIELMEIEAAAMRMDGLHAVCCVFAKESDQIVLYYAGSDSEQDVAAHMQKVLPRYMTPRKYVRADELPHTRNGKIDRTLIKKWVAKQ